MSHAHYDDDPVVISLQESGRCVSDRMAASLLACCCALLVVPAIFSLSSAMYDELVTTPSETAEFSHQLLHPTGNWSEQPPPSSVINYQPAYLPYANA